MNILFLNSNNSILNKLSELYKKNDYNITISNINEKKSKLENLINKFKITHIVCANTITDIDECEHNSDSLSINNTDIEKIYFLANKFKLFTIFISSYEVYGDSSNIPYTEMTIPSPINNLGISQLNSENIINKLPQYLILRTSWIYGTDSCFIKQILKNANSTLFFANTKIINPTPITFIFNALNSLLNSNKSGVFNCAINEHCSKYEVTEFLFKLSGIQKEVLTLPPQVKSKLVKSAEFSGLDSSVLLKKTKLNPGDWQTNIVNYITTELI
ncbi:MAG: sugar nucleotide-binding protein [Sarcina sp.]